MNKRQGGEAIAGWVYVISGTIALYGISVLWRQIHFWLRVGEWLPISILDIMRDITTPEAAPWLWAPTDWLGIYKMLQRFPAALAIFLVAGVVAVLAAAIADDARVQQFRRSLEESRKETTPI